MKLLYILMCIFPLLTAAQTTCAQPPHRDIPAFTSPERVYTGKSTQWIQQPIHYDEPVQADIVLTC